MRKRILIVLAILLVLALALHLHHSGGPGVLDSLRRSVHGEP